MANQNSSVNNKRFFVPSTGTRMGDIKRRKLNNGIERIKATLEIPLTSEDLQILKLEQSKAQAQRQKFINWVTYQRFKAFRPIPANKRPFSQTQNQIDRIPTAEKEWLQIRNRPKFKARPIPNTLKFPSISIKQSSQPLTVPQQFNLTPQRPKSNGLQTPNTGFKARPMPNFSSPIQQSIRSVQSRPLTKHSQESTLAKTIEEMSINQQKPFKARPMPSFPTPLTPRSVTPLTVPEEFNLTPFRQSQLQQTAKPEFKAKPMPDFSTPFQPVTGNHSMTTIQQNFCQNSEKRSKKRALFQEKLAESQKRKKQQREAEAVEAQVKEEQEIRELRNKTKFKARPLPKWQSFDISRSPNQLTIPQAPFLFTNKQSSRMNSVCSSDTSTIITDSSMNEDI